MTKILLSLNGHNTISSQITSVVQETTPDAFGVASAYLTYKGGSFLVMLAEKYKIQAPRIVIGTSGEVTQPNAIRYLESHGWNIRLGISQQGIFHPKMLVVGDSFSDSDDMLNPKGCYIGSANFTGPGLEKNTELGCTTTDFTLTQDVALAFRELWCSSKLFSEELLTEYEKRFSQRVKFRSFADLVELGVIDEPTLETAKKRNTPVLSQMNCSTVWVGLESFTGEHTFQVEVPKGAGQVLENIFGGNDNSFEIQCADGETRSMIYSYYTANGMYRLNVPNDVPLVSWARENRQGALVITRSEETGHLYAEIVRNLNLQAIQERSYALGTWGSTITRKYGWY